MKTREEALRRFKAAKQKKMNAVAALEERMKQAYEERTGMKANYVVTLWTAFPFTQLTAIIVRNDNPDLSAIIAEFTETISLLSSKP